MFTWYTIMCMIVVHGYPGTLSISYIKGEISINQFIISPHYIHNYYVKKKVHHNSTIELILYTFHEELFILHDIPQSTIELIMTCVEIATKVYIYTGAKKIHTTNIINISTICEMVHMHLVDVLVINCYICQYFFSLLLTIYYQLIQIIN
eukprot:421492_1